MLFEFRLPVLFTPGAEDLGPPLEVPALSSFGRSWLKALIGTSNCVPEEYLCDVLDGFVWVDILYDVN